MDENRDPESKEPTLGEEGPISIEAPTSDGETLELDPDTHGRTKTKPGTASASLPDQETQTRISHEFFSTVVSKSSQLANVPPAMPESIGDYELINHLGEGGMGVVYRARQRKADRIVALKVIRPHRLGSGYSDRQSEVIDRFANEARAAARLVHENIVPVYEVGEADGEHFFSMRLVEGKSLADLVREKPLENRLAAKYIAQVARGIQEAHDQGILHRDLKPQNILIDERIDSALVTDFGLAKITEEDGELTRDGEVMGTPSFMSPEQVRNSKLVTEQSDIYSLGATLYHVLTGRPVFQAASAMDTLRQVLDTEPVNPRQLNPIIDRELETICLKSLEKEPSKRFESARFMSEELERYLSGVPIHSRPIGVLQRAFRWSKRNPVTAGLISSTLACLLIALVVSSVAYVETSAAARKSDQSFRDALGAVNTFFTRVSEETLLNQPGLQPLRKDLLRQAKTYYAGFLKQRSGDPTVKYELADAHYKIGLITGELDTQQQALAAFDAAEEIQRELVGDSPRDPRYLIALSNTLNSKAQSWFRMDQLDNSLGLFDEAMHLRERAVDVAPGHFEYSRKLANTFMNQGIVEDRKGNFDLALTWIEKAQRLRKEILGGDVDDNKVVRDLGLGYFALGELFDREAIRNDQLARRFASQADEYYQKADSNSERARGYFERAAAVFFDLVPEENNIEDRFKLAQCYVSLARVRPTDDEAVEDYGKALQNLKILRRENPAIDKMHAVESSVSLEFAMLLAEMSDLVQAKTLLSEAKGTLIRLAHKDPDRVEYQENLALLVPLLAELEAKLDPEIDAPTNILSSLASLCDEFPDTELFQKRRADIEAELKQKLPNR